MGGIAAVEIGELVGLMKVLLELESVPQGVRGRALVARIRGSPIASVSTRRD